MPYLERRSAELCRYVDARTYPVHELLEAGAPTDTKNNAGLRPVDTIVGARAESELGKQCIEMLTMSQAEAQLEPTDIAYGTLFSRLTQTMTTLLTMANRMSNPRIFV